MNEDDALAGDPVAALDQMLAALKPLAQGVWQHFVSCQEAGFSPEQSLALTVAFQTALLDNAR